jgi:hypothetical protein
MDTSSKGMGLARVLAALVLGMSMVSAVWVGASAYERVKSHDQDISVTGSAEREIDSDVAKWTAKVSRVVEGGALQAGTQQLKGDIDATLAYLKSKGVKETDVTLLPLQASIVCDSQSSVLYDRNGEQQCAANKIAGWSLQQSMLVESHDPKLMTRLSQEASASLIEKGTVFTSVSLEYFYSKLAELKLEMLSEATKNAHARAESILRAGGKEVGELQSASVGVFQVSAERRLAASSKDVRVRVDGSKKTRATVCPRKAGAFFTERVNNCFIGRA